MGTITPTIDGNAADLMDKPNITIVIYPNSIILIARRAGVKFENKIAGRRRPAATKHLEQILYNGSLFLCGIL